MSNESPQKSYAAAVTQPPSHGRDNMQTEEGPVESKKLKLKEPNLMDITDEDGMPPIRLHFEVLLSPEMTSKDARLVICFGPPLSHWDTAVVEMRPKSDKIPGNYVAMAGVHDFPRRLVGKTIPYKYVVVKNNQTKWEHIFHDHGNGSTLNRCLIVPDKMSQFTKFDDVVFAKTSNKVEGWAEATKWMLPIPQNFSGPDFSLSSLLERFEQVLTAHGRRRVCTEDDRSVAYHPPGYSVPKQSDIYLIRLLKHLKGSLENNSDNMGYTLRLATYICLIRKALHKDHQFTGEHCQLMFRVFERCSQLLFDDASSLMSMDGETQSKACDALKLLVRNFVEQRVEGEAKSSGNWIHVVPFIHRWDRPNRNDGDWLKLDKWKTQLRSRYFLAF